MANTLTKLATVILIASVISCNKPECSTSNPVFKSNAPETQAYKAELAKVLAQADKEGLRYWIGGYKETNGQHYMLVDIIGKDLCATAEMGISPDDLQWENFIRVKGDSYCGAELEGLQYDTARDGAGIHFMFKSVETIID